MFKFFDKVKKSRAGYTLTELIVVVAILGILAAVATPLVLKQVQQSKVGADKGTAGNIETAVQLALADGTLRINSSKIIEFASNGGDATITNIQTAVKAQMAGNAYPTPQQNSAFKWCLNTTTGRVYCKDAADASEVALN